MCDKPKKWVDWLPWAEYSYNTSVHTSTKLIPFRGFYGRLPPKLLPYVSGTTKVQAVEDYLQDRDLLFKTLCTNLFEAQNCMKQFADRHRRELEFEVGYNVYVKLQPYRQSSIVTRSSAKLSPRFLVLTKSLLRWEWFHIDLSYLLDP